jgi:UDP-3-O-[3-hydroxymyristoyl] glucosamine N-acyltransferase
MPDRRFFKKTDTFKLKEIADFVDATMVNATGEEEIEDVATLEEGVEGEIGFLNNAKYAKTLENSKLSACLLNPKYLKFAPEKMSLLVIDNPYGAYASVAEKFYPHTKHLISRYSVPGIAKTAIIPSTCKLGNNLIISDYAVIGDCVEIGDDTFIGPNTVISDNVIIGKNCRIMASVTISYSIIKDNCIIHPGARIGQDGFGFAPTSKGIKKIVQLGRVLIGNDVEIGANTCIDRGGINDTVISDSTKIDNLVQIGHNSVIGENCFICGQVGLAGSSIIGSAVMLGGQVGVAGHLTIGNGSMISAQSGVVSDVPPKSVFGGYPAQPIRDWHRVTNMLKKLISKKSTTSSIT